MGGHGSLMHVGSKGWSNSRRLAGLMNHIFFPVTWLAGCILGCAWGTPGTRIHYEKKASRWRQYTATKTSCPGNHVEVTSKCTTYLRSRQRIAFRENGVTPYSHRPLSAGWCALLQNKNGSGIVLETQQHVRGVDLT